MCGIFGFIKTEESKLDGLKMAKVFGHFSESRGKDASGLAINNPLLGVKSANNFSRAFVSHDWSVLRNNLNAISRASRNILIGHTRLATNGDASVDENNQPVILNDFIGVHNGIICNTKSIEIKFEINQVVSELDSEVLFKAIHNSFGKNVGDDSAENRSSRWVSSLSEVYDSIEGAASIAIVTNSDELVLATNIGSIYSYCGFGFMVFSSEKLTLEDSLDKLNIAFDKSKIVQIKAHTCSIWTVSVSGDIQFTESLLNVKKSENKFNIDSNVNFFVKSDFFNYINSESHLSRQKSIEERCQQLTRCKICLIPSSHPFVKFDSDGVCNHCSGYSKIKYHPKDDLYEIANRIKFKSGNSSAANCIVPLSGGRDSVYVLHLAKKELGLNPVAYTYDWGLVTDLARRNQSRVCQALEIEHIVISADIKKKRNNVRMNVEAWLQNPDLGIIPLFMAGDKMFFTNANMLRDRLKIDPVLFGMTEFENNDFKEGFCGVDRSRFGEDGRFYHMGMSQQLQMVGHYLRQFYSNRGYINSSLIDTVKAYYAYYISEHNYILPYKYHQWNEKEIEETIIKNYNFELSPDTESSWRIGDGTASFYNYIYYSLAGFSESEPMRSNQIREGQITRDEGLLLSKRDNKPRYESFSWYCETIGLDPVSVMKRIDEMPFVENKWK